MEKKDKIYIGIIILLAISLVVSSIGFEKTERKPRTEELRETCEKWEVCDYFDDPSDPSISPREKYLCIVIDRNCTKPVKEEENEVNLSGWVNSTLEEESCMEDYDMLNYTTLQISKEEFMKLPCYRQRDWIGGVCYPEDCNRPNPPICTSVYMVYCYNPDSPENQYFRQIYTNNTSEVLR